jgi:hypothetical protein
VEHGRFERWQIDRRPAAAPRRRRLHLYEYADVFVMPTSSANAWRGGLIAA